MGQQGSAATVPARFAGARAFLALSQPGRSSVASVAGFHGGGFETQQNGR